jgi:radical SAM superfamily enzyme YgiQ (UPF0313 family)
VLEAFKRRPHGAILADILLSTLNARYIHASFGLRYLLANLGDLASRAEIQEFVIDERPLDIVERLLAKKPKILGLGVYIWNVEPVAEVVKLIKVISPETLVVLGGPEVSYGANEPWIDSSVDFIVTGEADVAFRELCQTLLKGERPKTKVIQAKPPPFDDLVLPYDLYTEDDIAHRVIYVEASRGCPFKCEFCLSSLDVAVRKPQLDRFLEAMEALIARGVKHFKFVDRTFNLSLRVSQKILGFFLERYEKGMFLHFEMVPDRLPEGLKELIAKFPVGSLQFEVGVQTLDPEVGARIQRRQNVEKLAENIRFLREHTGVHVHADLIVGLPGESVETFRLGFDRLIAMGPQEIQVGILKKLKGTPIDRHDEPFGMRYSPAPPFEILSTDAVDFDTMQRMRRFARFWDIFANSGNFRDTLPTVWSGGSAFDGFMDFSDFLMERLGQTHKISLARQANVLFDYLGERLEVDGEAAATQILSDFKRVGRREVPHFLRQRLTQEALRAVEARVGQHSDRRHIPTRQARHLG